MLHSFNSGLKIRALRGVLPAFKAPAIDQLKIEGLNPQALEQIFKVFGYQYCRQLPPPATFTDMMLPAIQEFLQQEQLSPQEIDGLISVTQTPDYMAPSNSFVYHKELNLMPSCVCLDLYGTCSGLFNALLTAGSLISSNVCQRILIITGDSFRFCLPYNYNDIEHLLGDGGGILLLEAADPEHSQPITLDFATFSASVDCSVNKILSMRTPSAELVQNTYPRIADIDYRRSFKPISASQNNSQQRMEMFKITRLAQQQTLHSLQRLLKHNNLKLSDLGCSVMYQCIKGTLDQLNLMLNQAVRAHLKHSQAPQTSAQAIDPWSCFDSERENFFPFVAEDVGHLFSSSQIISLSMSAERIPDCTTKPVFLSAFGAGMSITSALINFAPTHIYPIFIYQ